MQRRLRDQLLTNYMVAPLLPCSRIIEGAPNRTNTHAAIRVERRRRRRRTTAVVVVGPTGNQTKSLPKWRRKQFTHTHAVAQHNHHRRHRHHHHHPQCLSLACLLTPPPHHPSTTDYTESVQFLLISPPRQQQQQRSIHHHPNQFPCTGSGASTTSMDSG